MSQLENQESGDRAIASRPEAKSLQTADAQAARVAGASKVEAAQALNPNRHNGSAGGDRHESIQIVALEENGQQRIIAQRPRDIGQEQAKEITPEYIRDKAKTGDIYAQTFAKDLDMAEKLAAGPERDKAIADTLWKAECIFNPGKQKEAPETATNNRMDTGAYIALEAQTNPVAEPVAKLHQWVKEQPPGPEQEAFKQLVRQQAADLSPEMRAHMEQLAQQRAMSDQSGQETGGTHMAISPEMFQGRVTASDEPLTNTPEGWLNVGQKIAALPLLQQVEVIGSGLAAGIEQYQHDERQRAWGRLIGTVEGVGQVAVNLAKIADFGAALVLGDSERAGQMGAEFGNAVGETIVSGVLIFRAGDEYFQSVGYSGNYDKPFADLLVVANTLNERWNQLPPLEQERIKYRFFTEMTADGLIGLGGAKAIGKAKTFTEILDTAAQEVTKHGKQTIDATKKAAKAFADTIDDLLQPEFVTPDGQKIRLGRFHRPTADKPDTGMLMSKADDLEPKRTESGRPREPVPEKYTPPKWFAAELSQAIERLSEGEKANLDIYGISVQPVRRLTDVLPDVERLGACYSPGHKRIFVPQEIFRRGEWVPNDDVEFALSHEVGHVFNAKADIGTYISDVEGFRIAYKKDEQMIPSDILDSLQLSPQHKGPVKARDEVFADLYAHAKGLKSNNAYSQFIKQWFPNSLKVVEDTPKW